MATKKQTKVPSKKTAAKKSITEKHTEPLFPYTNKPGSLRRFLQLIPQKPKPAKVEKTLMQSWGFKDTNDMSILRVLRAVNLLNPANEPTSLYTSFMSLNGGAIFLAQPIRETYAPLFAATHTPYKESADSLKSLFNIHSGGSPTTLEYQIQTFKALAESTTFEVDLAPQQNKPPTDASGSQSKSFDITGPIDVPVHINLHIHLPENKSRRDYESIIEDIGRYIYRRKSEGLSDE